MVQERKRSLDALLINPISAKMIPAFVPHGLLYIGAYATKRGYNLGVYDRNVEEGNFEDIVRKAKPKLVGLGCLTGTSIDDAIYVSRKIKEIDSSIKIVWGGIHTTLYPDSVLKQDFVDFVIVGDGEAAFSAILDSITKSKVSLAEIDNLGYKQDNDFRYNQRSFVDLDEVPLPDWGLIEVEKYIRRKFYAKRVLTINTSRGCPYRCSFCCVPRVHQGNWRAMSPERIIAQLKILKSRYQIDGFQVDDEEFDIDRARVLKLCQLFKKEGLDFKWSHFSRVNVVKEEVLKEEISCGLQLIEFGVESGSNRMLKFLNKNQTLEQITGAYRLCRKLGLKTSALFMIGLPTEELKEIRQTLHLIKQLRSHLTICTVYKPYPGTELFNYCLTKGLFKYGDNLAEAGRTYDKMINTSNTPLEDLVKIKKYFDLRNIFQEIKLILIRLNFSLMIYYFIHYVLKPNRPICQKN
jgi:radical SAM superfamily enzyme YgiQ (UPF0313 family)